MPRTSTKNSSDSSAFGVNSSTGPRWAISLIRPACSRSPSISQDSSPACSRPRLTRSFSSRASEASSTSSTRSAATTHAPSASSTTMSPGADLRAADRDRLVDRPDDVLGGAAHAHPARPDGQAQLAQLLDVAHRRVDQHRRHALLLGLGGEQVADQRHRRRLGHREHQHVAGLRRGHRGVHHQVVVLPAAHGPRGSRRRACPAGPGRGRRRSGPCAPTPRRPSRRPAARAPRRTHSSSTTCGIMRWNASAWRTSWIPEARRAWLPRWSARWS